MNCSALLSLIEENQIARVTKAFETVIGNSFKEDFSRVTSTEVKRRFAICERIFRELRGDLKWTIERILDHLPKYLRGELDGIKYQPDARAAWLPETKA